MSSQFVIATETSAEAQLELNVTMNVPRVLLRDLIEKEAEPWAAKD
jgi:hypothetical protein